MANDLLQRPDEDQDRRDQPDDVVTSSANELESLYDQRNTVGSDPAADDLESLYAQSPHKDEGNSTNTGEAGGHQGEPGLQSLYKQLGPAAGLGIVGRLKAFGKNRKAIGGAVGGLGVIGLIVAGGFFINLFKLEHLLANIEQPAFERYNNLFDRRSDRWVRTYVKLRLSEPELRSGGRSGDDPLLFRSDGVDTDNPVRDWYQTMRTSSFEADLLQKEGIAFTSSVVKEADGSYRIRPAQINIADSTIDIDPGDIDLNDPQSLRRLSGAIDSAVDVEFFENNRAARRAIKDAVDSVTSRRQIIKRRTMRRNIQNLTGTPRWRFFEQTRDNIDAKKQQVYERVFDFVLSATEDGGIINCIFGGASCPENTDANNSDNHSNNSFSGDGADCDGNECGNRPDDPDTDGKNESYDVDNAARETGDEILDTRTTIKNKAGFIDDIMKRFVRGANIVGWLDTLARIDGLISTKALSKAVTLNRIKVATAFYTTYRIAGDQAKTGEDVDSQEYGLLMETLNGVERSSSFSQVSGSGSDGCPEAGQPESVSEEKYACWGNDDKIYGDTRAGGIEAAYNQSIGLVVSPILEVYRNSLGVVVQGLGDLAGKILEPALNAALAVSGLEDEVEDIGKWATEEVLEFAGGVPACTAEEPGGVIHNCLTAGAVASAETAIRYSGGADKTTLADAKTDYYVALARSTTNDSFSQRVARFWLELGNKGFGVLAYANSPLDLIDPGRIYSYTKSVNAISGAELANFVGMRTYDIPSSFIDGQDPLEIDEVSDCTNAENYNITGLTMSDVYDYSSFWQKVYAQLEDPEKAEQIWNGCTHDAEQMAGFAAVYSDKETYSTSVDGGDRVQRTNDLSSLGLPSKDFGKDSVDVRCPGGTTDIGVVTTNYIGDLSKGTPRPTIRLCQLGSIGGEGNNIEGQEIGGGAIVNAHVAAAWQALGEAAAADGINLVSSSSFRLADSCGGRGSGSACASPGQSSHQLGGAIDFADIAEATSVKSDATCSNKATSSLESYEWLEDNASRFGFKQYAREAWHWDADPNNRLSLRC